MKPNRTQFAILFVAACLLVSYLPNQSANAATEPWRVPLASPVLVKDFLQPSADWSAGHRGVDYLVEEGDTVFAPHSGRVKFVGKIVDREVISIWHIDGSTSTLEPVCSELTPDQAVHTGDVVGTICASEEYNSHCKARLCLHFGVKTETGYLSPLFKIGGLSPSRLKPLDGQIRSWL